MPAVLNWSAQNEITSMPEMAGFYGIIIKLFFGDHPPPNLHAVYGEYVALFNIETLEMIEGEETCCRVGPRLTNPS